MTLLHFFDLPVKKKQGIPGFLFLLFLLLFKYFVAEET
jgi:hypothetical protein